MIDALDRPAPQICPHGFYERKCLAPACEHYWGGTPKPKAMEKPKRKRKHKLPEPEPLITEPQKCANPKCSKKVPLTRRSRSRFCCPSCAVADANWPGVI